MIKTSFKNKSIYFLNLRIFLFSFCNMFTVVCTYTCTSIKGITSYLLFSFFQKLRCFILWMKVKRQEKELIVLLACFTIIFSTSHMERQQSSYIWIIALVKTRILLWFGTSNVDTCNYFRGLSRRQWKWQ